MNYKIIDHQLITDDLTLSVDNIQAMRITLSVRGYLNIIIGISVAIPFLFLSANEHSWFLFGVGLAFLIVALFPSYYNLRITV